MTAPQVHRQLLDIAAFFNRRSPNTMLGQLAMDLAFEAHSIAMASMRDGDAHSQFFCSQSEVELVGIHIFAY